MDPLGLRNEEHEVKLGRSFEPGSGVGFHSIRYDFKPASVDTKKMASLNIAGGNSVVVTVPHIEGSGTTHTVYKGNKRTIQKECVLIIDHQTGEITLEKLANTIQLKKTRIEGSSKASREASRPLTPSEQMKQLKSSPGKKSKKSQQQSSSQMTSQSSSQMTAQSSSQPSQKREAPPTMAPSAPVQDLGSPMEMSSSESGEASSDSSDDDDDEQQQQQQQQQQTAKTSPAKEVLSMPTDFGQHQSQNKAHNEGHRSHGQGRSRFVSMLSDTNSSNIHMNTGGPSPTSRGTPQATQCEDLRLSESGSDSD